jgi:hypothetical protein
MTQLISRKLAAQMISEYNDDQFFSVKFIKRTNNEVRDMVCRKGVKKYVTGGTLGYVPSTKNLVGVWDSTVADPAKAYRMINLDGLISFKMKGNTFNVV